MPFHHYPERFLLTPHNALLRTTIVTTSVDINGRRNNLGLRQWVEPTPYVPAISGRRLAHSFQCTHPFLGSLYDTHRMMGTGEGGCERCYALPPPFLWGERQGQTNGFLAACQNENRVLSVDKPGKYITFSTGLMPPGGAPMPMYRVTENLALNRNSVGYLSRENLKPHSWRAWMTLLPRDRMPRAVLGPCRREEGTTGTFAGSFGLNCAVSSLVLFAGATSAGEMDQPIEANAAVSTSQRFCIRETPVQLRRRPRR
ncbi:hypothetical protein QBC37DRAFT_396775 [Rhypophila decipiens]|uniref:Uncharacterized protein n=1 Tax=Rhypophila decipiens TaxID=261697 RepID=A0AAN6YDL0_9PEZI|nr:hypothetical protein QBC37DRAFT_396775 [Rhypophila decipiens]